MELADDNTNSLELDSFVFHTT